MPKRLPDEIMCFTCLICGKEARKTRKRNAGKYCSTQCAALGLTGANHHSYKGGKINQKGYRVISFPGGKRVLEHRHVMEQHLGRRLRRDEHVHHRNRVKHDNRIENLEVVSDKVHALLHAIENLTEAGYSAQEIHELVTSRLAGGSASLASP